MRTRITLGLISVVMAVPFAITECGGEPAVPEHPAADPDGSSLEDYGARCGVPFDSNQGRKVTVGKR